MRIKRWIVICTFVFASGLAAFGQCVSTLADPCIPVHQSVLDSTAQKLDELKAARDLIAKQSTALLATDKEREAFKAYMGAVDTAFGVLQKGIADREALIALQQKSLELYAVLVEKMQAALNKPKSGWQKFIGAVEKVLILAAGVAIGRGGI